jgi:maltooligosyltrehalose trehalohydrolase
MTDNTVAGTKYLGNNRWRFTVWAPEKQSVKLHIVHPINRHIEMTVGSGGYWFTEVANLSENVKYFYTLDGQDFPDPASHRQPDGVHGASQLEDHSSFQWTDGQWKGLPFKELILYELHVGTFSSEGTFEAIIEKLDDLVEVGINAIELLPVAQFPGSRNWGYDGVYPYAVQNSYGGPEGLKKLVDACHKKGIAVILDVVYNHMGPEGNYLSNFGPYFTKKYCTPWGDALNFDGEWSDGVREYFANNALYWLEYYHLDGLRLDAIHMVFDNGAVHFWNYTNEKAQRLQQKLGRSLHLIAESDLNNPKVVDRVDKGGFDFTAQWLDDFHHSLYVMLDEKGKKRYYDFGLLEQLAKAYKEGFVHSGEFVKFRKRKHGISSAHVASEKFVAFNLNHDQVGNRIHGERLCVLVDIERLKIAAAALLLSPYVPMLFMGEEYADRSPFYYFVSHSDEALVEAVRKGRKEEFKDYQDEGEPPDPQDEKTFLNSKLKWELREKGQHQIILQWHKQLIQCRTSIPALSSVHKNDIHTFIYGQSVLIVHRQNLGGEHHMLLIMNFSENEVTIRVPSYNSRWRKIVDSLDRQWVLKYHTKRMLPDYISADEEVSIPGISVSAFISVQ